MHPRISTRRSVTVPRLGQGRRHGALFHPYALAQAIVQGRGIRTYAEYMRWERPQALPSNPQATYKHTGWVSWGSFLGTGRERRVERGKFIPYASASAVARLAGICSQADFYAWRRPYGFPANPPQAYAGRGWIDWKAFLGTEPVPYEAAVREVREARITTQAEYRQWKRPLGVPSAPERTYIGKGWLGWSAFLGTVNTNRFPTRGFVPYGEALKITREAGIKSSPAYFAWDRPSLLPSRPQVTYAGKGWVCWGEFLGTGWKHRKDALRPPLPADQ